VRYTTQPISRDEKLVRSRPAAIAVSKAHRPDSVLLIPTFVPSDVTQLELAWSHMAPAVIATH
jgi:hypothetical protein